MRFWQRNTKYFDRRGKSKDGCQNKSNVWGDAGSWHSQLEMVFFLKVGMGRGRCLRCELRTPCQGRGKEIQLSPLERKVLDWTCADLSPCQYILGSNYLYSVCLVTVCAVECVPISPRSCALWMSWTFPVDAATHLPHVPFLLCVSLCFSLLLLSGNQSYRVGPTIMPLF